MTDNEIVKALECCWKSMCGECPSPENMDVCRDELMKDALDLIKRQQAEIDRLKEEQPTGINELLVIVEDDIRAEAIKEFAEKLKEKIPFYEGWGYITIEKIDNLVKEMGCGE